MSKQMELKLSKPKSGAVVRVRLGKIDPRYLHISDIDKIIGPHGDAASDAVERDMAMDEISESDDWD